MATVATPIRPHSIRPHSIRPSLGEATDHDLFLALREADEATAEAIREELVRRYTGLVRWLAGRYANPAVDVDELAQVGFLGLVLAIGRFDPERGSDFNSFARPTVQGEIRRYFRDKRRWIRLPRRLQETKAVLREATEKLTHELGRAPTVGELAARLAVDEELVLEAMTADDVWQPHSLDAPAGSDDEDDFTLADTIGYTDGRADLTIDCMALRPFLDELPDRERRILQMRFYEDMTQAQIGAEIGLSQMHVSRVLAQTLATLRAKMAAT
ncbi:MAG: SigB/SigF/SigG family RNA polymerase sigma factor [Sporichthyaceae bacterium]